MDEGGSSDRPTLSEEALVAVCRDVYAEMRAFYSRVQPRLGSAAFGFRILYGPPLVRPPILFLGYQPGGGTESDNASEREGWPAQCEYSIQPWPLARVMRHMFPLSLLEKCTGLNAIFIRAPRMQEYVRATSVVPHLRHEVESFCLPRVARLIEAMDPQQIVAIGFPSLELFGPLRPVLTNPQGRVLAKEGVVGTRPALATLHLSGARISTVDRTSIARYILRNT